MMNCVELSLEQQYTLRILAEKVKALSREEAHQNLIELYRQMMVRENYPFQDGRDHNEPHGTISHQ